ncbi:SUMO-activating enzyme subunit 1 [Acipenser ruthenus]|uniref:SUMO-activating enzyme subunit 1 n=1 Tax=Acipenser ruthenus TaxID=7906 RepID=A0A444U6D4_ACIRT|nr:SUMO-activating enzyme subunit 1 [Acipenser ruthenus]
MVEKEETLISEEEAAQYDRQIRLWGLDAQKRLRASRVLLVGMKGLGAEVAKNLILSGVKGITMLDHEQVTEDSVRAQFLIPAGSLDQNRAEASLERAQNLNPMVEVKADPERAEDKPDEFFFDFDAVCLTCCPRDLQVRLDQLCHKNNIKFFTGDVFGYHGFMFSDLGVEHHYVDFCQLKKALEVDWTSEKAKSALKRTPTDYFLLQGREWEEKRRLNIEKMNEEMEKIAEYERGNRSDGQGEKNPGRNFLDDPRRSGPAPDADRKERSRRHVRNWGGVDFERVKTGGPERDKEWQGRRSGGPKGPVDVMSMTGRERSEYERWKQEREQIDQDRLSRHRNATGQWRREWDAQKTESTMHDNRWEEEDEAQEKVGQGKEEAPCQEADEDQWEDASEEEEGESEEEEEKKTQQKRNKKRPSLPPTSKPQTSPPRLTTPRTRREGGRRSGGHPPKLQLPPKQTTPESPSQSPKPCKPLSPFSLAEDYCPVTDWGEEMELQSPRSSLGESPLGQPTPANPKPTFPKSEPGAGQEA